MLKNIAMLTLLVGTVMLASLAWGAYRWKQQTQERRIAMQSTQKPVKTEAYSEKMLAQLPAPVQRYFKTVMPLGLKRIHEIRMTHSGQFNMSETGQQWHAFKSDQRVLTRPAAFDWDGSIAIFPGIWIRVHDSYFEEQGQLRASFAGLLNLANMSGTTEMAEGELMRFYAEAPWYPTALLPSDNVTWVAVDPHSAMLLARDGSHQISLLFHFNSEGLIDTVSARERGRSINGKMVPTPWQGRWSNYQKRNNVLIPMQGEVAWLPISGKTGAPHIYWRGDVESIQYVSN